MNLFSIFKRAPDPEQAPLLPTEPNPIQDEIFSIKQNLLYVQNLLTYLKEEPIVDLQEESFLEQKKQQIKLQITEILQQTKRDIAQLSKDTSVQSTLFFELNKLSKEFSTYEQQNLDKFNYQQQQQHFESPEYETMTDVQIQQINLLSEDIEVREKEIKQIASSISEMGELMKDIAHLVSDQGELVNNIEYTIEQAGKDVEKGVVEIKKAAVAQKRSRTFYCVLLFLILIIVVIIIMFVKLFA